MNKLHGFIRKSTKIGAIFALCFLLQGDGNFPKNKLRIQQDIHAILVNPDTTITTRDISALRTLTGQLAGTLAKKYETITPQNIDPYIQELVDSLRSSPLLKQHNEAFQQLYLQNARIVLSKRNGQNDRALQESIKTIRNITNNIKDGSIKELNQAQQEYIFDRMISNYFNVIKIAGTDVGEDGVTILDEFLPYIELLLTHIHQAELSESVRVTFFANFLNMIIALQKSNNFEREIESDGTLHISYGQEKSQQMSFDIPQDNTEVLDSINQQFETIIGGDSSLLEPTANQILTMGIEIYDGHSTLFVNDIGSEESAINSVSIILNNLSVIYQQEGNTQLASICAKMAIILKMYVGYDISLESVLVLLENKELTTIPVWILVQIFDTTMGNIEPELYDRFLSLLIDGTGKIGEGDMQKVAKEMKEIVASADIADDLKKDIVKTFDTNPFKVNITTLKGILQQASEEQLESMTGLLIQAYQKQTEQKNTIITLGIGIGIASLLIILLLVVFLVKMNKKNKKIEEQKNEVQTTLNMVQKYREGFETRDEAAFILDIDGTIEEVNHAAKQSVSCKQNPANCATCKQDCAIQKGNKIFGPKTTNLKDITIDGTPFTNENQDKNDLDVLFEKIQEDKNIKNISFTYKQGKQVKITHLTVFTVGGQRKVLMTNTDKTAETNLETKLAEKNKELIDSIKYAQYTQQAFFSKFDKIAEKLQDRFPNFISLKPKDILSGDFYWLYEDGQFINIMGGDCTGHGVSGSLLSVYFLQALELLAMAPGSVLDLLLERGDFTDEKKAKYTTILKELTQQPPDVILTILRDMIVSAFKDSPSNEKLGMDAQLIRIDKQQNSIEYAGANNPLFIIIDTNQLDEFKNQCPDLRDANEEEYKKNTNGKTLVKEVHLDGESNKVLLEIQADKFPVGPQDGSENQTFGRQTMPALQGMSLYLFSDGFEDQFGGPNGKKFLKKKFKNLLLEIADKPMKEQKQILEKTLQNRRGNHEQIDDILVMGIQIQ